MRLKLWLFATLALLPIALTMPATAAPIGGDKAFEQAANAAVDRVAREDGFSGAILVARGDQILLRRASGFADRERKIPNTPDTKFSIESITKQFTAAAILLLVEDGKVALSDPIVKYYPDIPPVWNTITIAELLTHGSGIDDCVDNCRSKPDVFLGIRTHAGALRVTASKTLAFKPGTDFLYSNVGYGLLTAAIERASGENYAQFMRQRVFEPLGLRHTGSGPIPADVVKGYIRTVSSGREPWQIGETENLGLFGGFGSIYSTLNDMLAWNRGLQAGKLLSAAS
jgi:CubicO group peptidase (beta-lactamase class C family)